VYASTDVPGAINGMVQTVMGYPPNHPLFAQAVQILTDHNTMAATMGSNRNNRARDALRSTFALACESPRALGIGL
jgi:hypothetical protein